MHHETCFAISRQANTHTQTHKIVQIHSETVFNVSSLLLDDTFQPVMPLNDGAVSEALRHFASLRDDRMRELLD